MTIKEQIIKLYETKTRPPSYSQIANAVKSSKAYVYTVIRDYNTQVRKVAPRAKSEA